MGNKQASRRGNSRDDEEESKLTLYQQAKQGYNELVNAIIRPPRAEYMDISLGPILFTRNGLRYKRVDLELRNIRDQTLLCSHWMPETLDAAGSEPMPCVVYLHGNSSCRMEALDCLNLVLPQNYSLFSFDFSGSGRSDGDYISLGWFERDDVGTVVEYLRSLKYVSTIGLWGRSMGAVTALMYGQRDPSLACLVLDSPFASLPQLAKELVEGSQVQVPKFAVALALKFIRNSVKSRAKFDINKLETIKFCDTSFIPAIFGSAQGDNFIKPHHAQQLHDRYPGDKSLFVFPGNHNTKREKAFLSQVSRFLFETMVVSAQSPSTAAGAPVVIESEGQGEFVNYELPLPMRNMKEQLADGRRGVGTGGDVNLMKALLVDEDEKELQRAMQESLEYYEIEQKKLMEQRKKKKAGSYSDNSANNVSSATEIQKEGSSAKQPSHF